MERATNHRQTFYLHPPPHKLGPLFTSPKLGGPLLFLDLFPCYGIFQFPTIKPLRPTGATTLGRQPWRCQNGVRCAPLENRALGAIDEKQ